MTHTFVQYNSETGEIINAGTVSDDTLEAMVIQGVSAILDAPADRATHYVDVSGEGPVLMEYTEQERAALAALPPGWGWQMPGRVANDLRELADVAAAALVKVDALADEVRAKVVGDPVRVVEYKRAEDAARAFKVAGQTGAPGASVASWARAKGWTNEQAADDIIVSADRWYAALDGIRGLRLQAKEDVRRATTNAAIDDILATFEATLTAAMQGVQ